MKDEKGSIPQRQKQEKTSFTVDKNDSYAPTGMCTLLTNLMGVFLDILL